MALCWILSEPLHCVGDEVDNYVTRQMRRQHAVGLSLAVVKDSRLVLAKGFGSANVELDFPVNRETGFDIASIGKQFTAAAAMILVEQAKMRLDDRITNYLSDLPQAWSQVTIRHLLTHTSGIKNYTDLPNFKDLAKSHISTQKLVKLMADYPLDFAPGERWAYSNTGYHLLADIIENVSGKPYETFLKERIFAPLQMNSTWIDDGMMIITNRASGYSWQEGVLHNADYFDMSWTRGAGGEVSTVLDMAKWDAALDSERLLSKKRLEQMWTPVRLNDGGSYPYGFGWQVFQMDSDHRLLAHSGFDFGFNSCIYRWIDDRTTVIVLLTAGTPLMGNGSDSADYIAWGLSRHFIPRLKDKAIKDTSPEMTGRAKGFLESIIQGTFDSKLLAEGIRTQWPPKGKRLASELEGLGEMRSFQLVRKEDDGPIRTYSTALDSRRTPCSSA
jgi:D-alanyl-D-alanine carboxypeptidase